MQASHHPWWTSGGGSLPGLLLLSSQILPFLSVPLVLSPKPSQPFSTLEGGAPKPPASKTAAFHPQPRTFCFSMASPQSEFHSLITCARSFQKVLPTGDVYPQSTGSPCAEQATNVITTVQGRPPWEQLMT